MKDVKSDKELFLLNLGERLKTLREEKGLSQSELANICNKDRQSLERVENGRVNPSIFYLNTIAKGLGVSLKVLMDF